MAELAQQDSGHKKGKKKGRKKMSTKIDLTPMVDLGFLLVTFFMLTTTFSKPQTMEINLPVKEPIEKPEDEPGVKASKSLTIIMGEDNKLFWYMGVTTDPLEGPIGTDYTSEGIRKVLLEKNATIDGLIVLIKPADKSVYKNVVDILDEMNISNIQRYALVEITPEDMDLIKNL
ncbi:MAG: biopolymer transporter ExbD [Ignavibacteriales bacterium]|nr:biopolymer transporter ExbD [Ignavibacteriales bacterium]